MHYEKRGDPFPIMHVDDERVNPLQETNDFRRTLNRHHWALGQYRSDHEDLQRLVGGMCVAFLLMTMWMIFLTVWVFVL